jgi:hypothetical protein
MSSTRCEPRESRCNRVALFSVENSPTLTSYWAETDVISGPHWEVMEPRKMEDENMT